LHDVQAAASSKSKSAALPVGESSTTTSPVERQQLEPIYGVNQVIMVSYTQIQASNALINDDNAPHVAVFVGGTSGIGQLTLRALVAKGTSIRIYLIGRKSSADRASAFVQELRSSNPRADIRWLEGEISLLAETKRLCDAILKAEPRIDLLFLTAGYAPFGARQETSEGIEIAQSLEYYSRMLFIQSLLPALSIAEAPRVVSVLGGGLEKGSMNIDDIDLKQPAWFRSMRAQPQFVMLNTVGMDKLATENPKITFIHSWPGMVDTGNVWRGVADPKSWLGWSIWLFLEPVIRLISFTEEESAQRNLFLATSAAFGGSGTTWTGKQGPNVRLETEKGLFLANLKCDSTPNAKNVAALREQAQAKVWAHTENILRPYAISS
jgi:NAD(P)-dependent dehydrogenase (short-subunit alcohol dehydrogenase family)